MNILQIGCYLLLNIVRCDLIRLFVGDVMSRACWMAQFCCRLIECCSPRHHCLSDLIVEIWSGSCCERGRSTRTAWFYAVIFIQMKELGCKYTLWCGSILNLINKFLCATEPIQSIDFWRTFYNHIVIVLIFYHFFVFFLFFISDYLENISGYSKALKIGLRLIRFIWVSLG